ncbi:ribonuclease HI family protein [Patescibacteria group bacterium]|nr:ribonuclease HI family protein [Patescibacteria group bacterium]MBU1722075.1 ribonuclease HI family protein [Patescibacteria group bacterium]MBU1901355.1 ribonuclease HI family protein [Patescibacteria group bacterium]
MNVSIYTDGGARGNPGPAATGIIIKNDTEETIKAYGEYLGEQTNNYAEYKALISALHTAKKIGATSAHCYLDSKLVVEQLNRRWKVKNLNIQKLFVEAWNSMQQFEQIKITHIRREKNKEADAEVNKVLDAR